MNDSYIMKEIDKTMNFIERKIYEGRLLIDIIDTEKNFYAEIKNSSYNFFEEEKREKTFKGILLLNEKEKELNEFKEKIKKNIWKLDSNGFIIIKYVNYDNLDIDLKKDAFENYLKIEGFIDIESYILLNKNSNEADSKQELIVMARMHEELLDESPEYEEYTINVMNESKCGGCSKKSGGCSKENGSCESCSGCCKK